MKGGVERQETGDRGDDEAVAAPAAVANRSRSRPSGVKDSREKTSRARSSRTSPRKVRIASRLRSAAVMPSVFTGRGSILPRKSR